MKYTVVVVLENGTVGITEKKVEIGQVVTVLLQDENGNYIEDTGKVEEILKEEEY